MRYPSFSEYKKMYRKKRKHFNCKVKSEVFDFTGKTGERIEWKKYNTYIPCTGNLS